MSLLYQQLQISLCKILLYKPHCSTETNKPELYCRTRIRTMSPTSTTSAAPDATLNTVARESRTKRRLDAVMQELKLIKNNNRKKARKM